MGGMFYLGYVDGQDGIEPQSEDPDYVRGYEAAQLEYRYEPTDMDQAA